MISVFFKRLLSLVLLICVFMALPVFSAADIGERDDDFVYTADFSVDSFGDVIERYLSDHNIAPEKFTMGFYDTVTGESWYYNGDVFMQAGSMFKLPMNMIYCDRVYNGEMEWDDLAGDYTLSTGMEKSIVYSNNAVSYSMLDALASRFADQRELLAGYSDVELDEIFFKKNFFSPEYMISVLKILYENDGGRYDRILEFMQRANQNLYFCYYEQPYTVAHKYGSWEGNLNDCGIIYGPHPILLTVFTYCVAHDEDTLAQVCRIASDYSAYLGERDIKEQEALDARKAAEEKAAAEAAKAAQRTLSETAAEAPQPTPVLETVSGNRGSVVPLYICIGAAVTAGGLIICRRVKSKKKLQEL